MSESQAQRRILRIVVDEDTGNFSAVSDIKFYRTQQSLDDDEGFDATFEAVASDNDTVVIDLGEVLPPPNVIVIERNVV